MLDRLGLVVVALVHLAAAPRADVDAGRGRVPTRPAGAPRGEPLDDDVGLHGDEKRRVERAVHGCELGVERHGLGGVAGEAVEDEALLGIIVLEALLDEIDDELVRDELAGVHEGLRLLAELRLSLHSRAEEVAGGDVREAILLDELLRLSALACAGSAEQNDVHGATAFPFDRLEFHW